MPIVRVVFPVQIWPVLAGARANATAAAIMTAPPISHFDLQRSDATNFMALAASGAAPESWRSITPRNGWRAAETNISSYSEAQGQPREGPPPASAEQG